MTLDEVYNTLQPWLRQITGLNTIILSHPDAPRPQGVYGMLNLTRMERINWPDDLVYEEAEEGTGTDGFPALEIPVETWEASWSFNVYGPGGADILSRVTSAGKSPAAQLQLHPVVLHRTSGVRRIPEQVESVWEDRAQIDLFIHYRMRQPFGADLAEQHTVQFAEETASQPE